MIKSYFVFKTYKDKRTGWGNVGEIEIILNDHLFWNNYFRSESSEVPSQVNAFKHNSTKVLQGKFILLWDFGLAPAEVVSKKHQMKSKILYLGRDWFHYQKQALYGSM